MKTIPTVGKMIHVVWEDIFEMGAGWHSKADVDKHKPIACESIGWVHKTTDKYLTLIGDKSIDGKEKEISLWFAKDRDTGQYKLTKQGNKMLTGKVGDPYQGDAFKDSSATHPPSFENKDDGIPF